MKNLMNFTKFNENIDDMISKMNPNEPITRDDLVGKIYDEKIGWGKLPDIEIKHAVEFVPSGTFGAVNVSGEYLKDLGYTKGSMDGGSPIGFSKKYTRISKWGNMSSKEHALLDGAIIPVDGWREGGAIIMWFVPPVY